MVALGTLFIAWPRRHDPLLRWFVVLCAATAWAMLVYGLEGFALDDLPTFLTLAKLEYIGLVVIPVAWLGLALAFTAPERLLTHRQIALLSVIPLMTLALVFTNEWHGLIWQQPQFTLYNDVPVFTPLYGGGFWGFVVYAYALLAVGTWRILRSAQMRWRVYRVQAALLLVGAFFPWARSILIIFDELNPLPGIALDALIVAMSLAAYAYALLRLNLFHFVPFAYRTVFDLMPYGSILLDRANYILAVNQEVVMFTGQDRSALEGRPAAEVFPEHADWLRQLPTHTPLLDTLNVNERAVEVNAVPIRNEGNNVIGTLIQVRDITLEVTREVERQRAEQTARVIHEMLQALTTTLNTDEIMQRLLESLPRLVAHDAANIMLYDAAKRTAYIRYTSGYSAEEEAWLRRQRFSLEDYATLATAEATRQPVIIPHVADFVGWVELDITRRIYGYACAPILVEDAVFGFINLDTFREGVLSTDIAHRLTLIAQQASIAFRNARLYEQAQRQADELQRRIDGMVILQNMAREIATTICHDELTAIGLEAMLRLAQTRGGFIALMNDQQLRRSAYYGEYELDALDACIEDPDKLLLFVEQVDTLRIITDDMLDSAMADSQMQIILPLRYINATTTRLMGVAVLEDTTQRHLAADHLEILVLLADRLAVALRNADLVQELSNRATELETLNTQLKDLEQLKSEMLRVAAHDLKTPLSVILNYVDLLPTYYNKPDELQQIYKDIRQAGQRMSRIVNDFLSLERISKLATHHTTQVFAVQTLIDRLEVDFFMAAYRKEINLDFRVEQGPLYGVGDPELVYEALLNFVSNAIKYTQRGGHVIVHAAITADRLRVSVTDNGPGIPKAEQANLFTAFYRTSTAQQSDVEGTGLGLHLAKVLIERLRGRVFFTSVEGQGSTFGFELPLPTAED